MQYYISSRVQSNLILHIKLLFCCYFLSQRSFSSLVHKVQDSQMNFVLMGQKVSILNISYLYMTLFLTSQKSPSLNMDYKKSLIFFCIVMHILGKNPSFLLGILCSLDILFRQITTLIKVRMVFVFRLQTLSL